MEIGLDEGDFHWLIIERRGTEGAEFLYIACWSGDQQGLSYSSVVCLVSRHLIIAQLFKM